MAALLALALGWPVSVTWSLIHGFEGRADNIPMPPAELAKQVVDATQYLQGLATSVLGLIGFLLSERVSTYWQKLTAVRKRLVMLGALLCGLSICVGFAVHVAVLSLSADEVVRDGVARVLRLSLFQAAELALGVLLIGTTALSALGSSHSNSPAATPPVPSQSVTSMGVGP